MAIFLYRTTKLDGTIHEGTIEAEDRKAAGEKLKDSGFIPLSLTARNEGLGGWWKFSFRFKKVDLITFTTELSALLNAGLPLDRALHIILDIS